MKKILVLVCLCSCVLMFLGCAALRKEKSLAGLGLLEPQAVSKFTDVPVPAGFKFLTKDSYSFEAAGVRVGVLKYQGKASPDRVINFYKEQMPMYNWNLLNVIEYGDRLLNFDRDRETCIINLLPKGNTITLIISVGPKSQLSPKKAKEPIK